MSKRSQKLPTTFTARGPVDLLAVVPYVLGFHPADSVVMLTFGPGESFHARVDLPVRPDHQVEVVEMLLRVLRQHRVGRVALLVYTDDAWAAASFHDVIVPRLVRRRVEVVDVLRVARDRFHSARDVEDPGTAYDLRTHLFTAEQVLEGTVVPDSRDDLASTLDPAGGADAAAVEAAAVRHAERLQGILRSAPDDRLARELVDEARWVQRTVRSQLRTGGPVEATVAGRLLVVVSIEEIRDVAWSEMTRDNAAQHLELWRDLVRRCPPGLVPAAAALLAFAAWLDGHGALAWCAIDRCRAVDPAHALADQVGDLLENAVPPSVWRPIAEADLSVFRPPGQRAS